jgi:hypothetical protein
MQRVFAAVSVLLPEAARDDGFANPARREAAKQAFATLRSAAAELENHGEHEDAGFQLLARGLADDVLVASAAFDAGNAPEARYAFHALTQRCIDCHARLPYPVDSPLAERLIALPEVKALAPVERARFDVALRRFDDALGLLEGVLADAKIPPARLELEGALADYLTIAIRVKGDTARARETLAKLARRSDTPIYLRTRLVTWDVSLRKIGEKAAAPPSLADARAFAAMARNLSDVTTARDGLVYDLAASGLLWRFIQEREKGERRQPDLELADAYYELAVVEDRTAFSFWVPQTDAYMEAALRAAPGGPRARRAYARIEEQLLTDFGAASVAELPGPDQRRLAELAKLLGSSS